MDLLALIALMLFVISAAGLVRWVRHDGFGQPRTPARDELGMPYRSRISR